MEDQTNTAPPEERQTQEENTTASPGEPTPEGGTGGELAAPEGETDEGGDTPSE